MSDTKKRKREWLVIESTTKRAVFGDPNDPKHRDHYIPRDVAEKLLGKSLEGIQWFTREESALMHSHPEWTDTLSPPPRRKPSKRSPR